MSESDLVLRASTDPPHKENALLALKPAQQIDEAFMLAVYANSRADEMALTGWRPNQQDAFLYMQFDAQKHSYATQFPQAEYSVVEWDGAPCGRLIVDRSGKEILLIDLALLAQFRRKGIGSILMGQLMEEGTRTGKAIRLHVERFNPILSWYQRLGFKTESESAIYLEMLWTPGAADTRESRQSEPGIPLSSGGGG
jgi:ribosomal protein S18 acetylase RimI-like enzyme